MKILHYIPSIDRTSGGVGTYMQLLTAELGKLVELHVVTHKETNPLELKNCHVHFIENNNPFLPKEKKNFICICLFLYTNNQIFYTYSFFKIS